MKDAVETLRNAALPKPYYENDAVTIYHGDCRAILPHLQLVDAVITDPPYSETVHGKSRRGGATAPPKDGRGKTVRSSFSRTKDLGFEHLTIDLRATVAHACAALARRWVLVFSDVESDHLWRKDLTFAGLEYIRTCFWEKAGGTPQFTGDRPATPAEAITIMRSEDYDLEAVLAELPATARHVVYLALEDAARSREESEPTFGEIVLAHPKGKKHWNGGGSQGMFRVPIALNRDKKTPRRHPTEKPIELMLRLVELFSEPGELVLDPFAGGGTTLLASKLLGRKAIGIELEEQWCEETVRRLAQEMLPFGWCPQVDVEIETKQAELFASRTESEAV